MLIPLLEWNPDTDETRPGIMTDVEHMIPTMKGYKGAPQGVNIGLASLPTTVQGATLLQKLDGSYSLFAGTLTKLWLAGSTTWTEVTRVSGVYTGNAAIPWRFAQQGNVTFAVNRVDTCQEYDHAADTDFSDLTAMPICSVVEAVGQFVMVGDYINPVGSVSTPDGWACSAIGDYTDWTASTDTQCVYGRLYDTPGKITAIKRLGDYAIYYKNRSMYLARYVGAPTVWEFSLVSDIVGAVSQEAVCKVGQQHFFLGEDDFYSYDTASITPIGGPIREWFNNTVNYKYRHTVQSVHDRINGIIYWYYPTQTSTTLDAYVAFNYRVGKWGKGTQNANALTEYVVGGKTYAEIQAAYPLYSDYDGFTYGTLQASQGTPLPARFGIVNGLRTLTGECAVSYMTPNIMGADSEISLIRRLRCRYLDNPTAAELTNFYTDQLGSDWTEDKTTTETNGKFDVIRSARWHKGELFFRGDVEITALDVEAKYAGRE